MTPIRRQYLKIKHSYPGAIVLFRLGDFYETFDEDARLASQELEITLTSRSMGKDLRVPMAGVPAHALENYLARLVKKGHQVAICEQLSDPASSRGLVERDVVRVVTPGTVFEPGLLDQSVNNYLAAVLEDDHQAGLAYVDITTGEFAATQLNREQLPLELERISPAEILTPRSDDGQGWIGPAAQGTSADYHSIGLATGLDPALFGHTAARDALLSYFQVQSLESFGCQELPLAVGAAGAVLEYLKQTQQGGGYQLDNLRTYSASSFMALDSHTRRNLELFQPSHSDNKRLCLLGSLDETKTPMGARLLRQWLGRPLLDLAELNQRLESVDYFFEDGFRRVNTRSILSPMPDLERIVGRVSAGSATPRDLKSLQTGLEILPQLVGHLNGTSSNGLGHAQQHGTSPLAGLARQLVSLPEVVALIEQAIAAEPTGEVGEGNIIREGFCSELDELKLASQDAKGFIAGLEKQERERTGIKGLRVGYNQVFGYYIEVTKSNQAQVPEDYIRRQSLANAERFIIPQLKEYESLVLNARERIHELESSTYKQVCAQVKESASSVASRASAVAQIDVLSSLAEVAVNHGYVMPVLDQGDALIIEDGRHPVVERVLEPGAFVPNDLRLSNEPRRSTGRSDGEGRIMVLTGPNMAGKSTYIRQVALIVLMAQIGSFVPAAAATIGLVDRIFTRVGLHDDLATGQSTFMAEMVETAAIINQATPRSLVVLDEIGRGTSTYDGLSIARSVLEHLHNDQRLGCKTLFATHYHELTDLAKTLPGVRNFNVAVAEEDNKVVFLRRIVPGGSDKSYGVQVAQLAGLPQGVINRAWEVLADLERSDGAVKSSGSRRPRRAEGHQMSLFNPAQPLMDEIQSLDIPNLTPLEAINLLYELQRKANEVAPPESAA